MERMIRQFWESVISGFDNRELTETLIVSVLAVVTVLALYEYVVYRFILRRSLYNKAFNISIAVIPYFIAMMVMCLQSSLTITLGTIGALAIIRFRNAVKDPIDLVFLLWSVFLGISCGCRLFSMAALTSVTVTLVLIALNYLNIRNKTHILVMRLKSADSISKAEECLKSNTRHYRVKSQNYTGDSLTVVIELRTRDVEGLLSSLRGLGEIDRMSLMEYDYDDGV